MKNSKKAKRQKAKPHCKNNTVSLSAIALEVAAENTDVPKITHLPSDAENLEKYGAPNPPVPNRAHTEI